MSVPPADGMGTPPPPPLPPGPAPVPMYGQPVVKKTALPLVSFIFGLLAFCIPFIGGLIAVVTGFMGRKKAKALGQKAGLATAGIILGFIGLIMSLVSVIVLAAGGFAVFNAVSGQVAVADQLQKAIVVADQYAASTGSYEGLTTARLVAQGYSPDADIVVTPTVGAGGSSICMEGSQRGSGSNLIHMPVQRTDVATLSLDLNGRSYSYALGSCP